MRGPTLCVTVIVSAFWLSAYFGFNVRADDLKHGSADAKRIIAEYYSGKSGGEGNSKKDAVDLVSKLTEKVDLKRDQKPWELGFSNANQGHIISEFVRPGETVHTWTELLTFQVLPGKQTNPRELMLDKKAAIVMQCPDVRWSVLRKGKEEILYEWQVTNCPGVGSEQEISKIIQGKMATHRVAYTTKRVPMSEENRETWTTLIAKAKLVGTAP